MYECNSGKVTFGTEEEAMKAAQVKGKRYNCSLAHYLCKCGKYHLTTIRKPKPWRK